MKCQNMSTLVRKKTCQPMLILFVVWSDIGKKLIIIQKHQNMKFNQYMKYYYNSTQKNLMNFRVNWKKCTHYKKYCYDTKQNDDIFEKPFQMATEIEGNSQYHLLRFPLYGMSEVMHSPRRSQREESFLLESFFSCGIHLFSRS